jgi:hypothetical protein
MTLPNEWFISMKNTREFLFQLLDAQKTPKVPREIRKKASDCLKHFPMKPDIDELEQMYSNSHKDKGIIIGEVNKELKRIAGEAMLVNARLTSLGSSLQEFINKP